MTTRNDDDVDRLLKRLPRHQASPEFTERLMERLESEPSAIFVQRRWVLLALAAILLGIWLGGRVWQERRERREAAARLEMMRNEYRALERELDELRSLASDAQPVVEIGGTEDVDFILDLSQLARRERMRAAPTSHSPK